MWLFHIIQLHDFNRNILTCYLSAFSLSLDSKQGSFNYCIILVNFLINYDYNYCTYIFSRQKYCRSCANFLALINYAKHNDCVYVFLFNMFY